MDFTEGVVRPIEDFGFDLEVLYLAHRLGYRIVEMPVRWVDNDETRVRFLRDSFRILRDMFLIRFKRYEIPADARPEKVRRGIPEVSAGGGPGR